VIGTSPPSSRHLLGLRSQYPAWRLLAARTGPLVIGTLKALFDENLKWHRHQQLHQWWENER